MERQIKRPSEDIGELVDASAPESQVEELNTNQSDTVNLDENDPHANVDVKDLYSSILCNDCGNRVVRGISVYGLCPTCAMRRMRAIESKLMDLKRISSTNREYCCLSGHGELRHVKSKPEWNGEISINGIKLYPVIPLCSDCLNVINAFLVTYLEDRGFLRKGSGHKNNEFAETHTALSTTETLEAKKKLEAFMASARIHVLEKQGSIHTLYKNLKDKKRLILKREAKECQKEKEEDKNQNASKS